MTSTTVPILPKPTFSTPVIYVPVTFTRNTTMRDDSRIDQFAFPNMTGVKRSKTVANTPPAAPPPPPPSFLNRSKLRIPLLIDQRSLKKNLQVNKISLQRKLARRPEANQLIDRNILRTEGAESRISCHRENLQRRIEKRPPRQDLVTQRILLSSAGIDPLVQARGQLLQRCKLADNLNSKLRTRPGPLELVTRKILQVDAELEQAIEEGRLPFTTTRTVEDTLDHSGMITALSAPNRFDAPMLSQTLMHSQSPPTISRSQKAKVRKKSGQIHRSATPYDNIPVGKVAKNKTASKKSMNEANASPMHIEYATSGVLPMETDDGNMIIGNNETNYEVTLKQQQIFLQWQEDHYKTVTATESNAVTPALSSTTSNCSTPLQSNDGLSMHSTGSNFSTSSANSLNHGNSMRLQSVCSPSLSPPSNCDMHHASGETDKPRSKLADLKVNDLKNECKKRSLPVSGAKPQLVERLRPYEAEILVQYTSHTGSSLTLSTTNNEVNIDPTTTAAVSGSTSCSHLGDQTVTLCQSQSSMPVHDVIHDYLQQCQPQTQQKPIILQLPLNAKAPQTMQLVNNGSRSMENLVVKVLDSNGTVIGMGTMPQQTRTVVCCCAQCKQTPKNHVNLTSTSECSTQPVSLIHPPTAPQFTSENKIGDATFSFSQMGSGGQFTLAQSTTPVTECRSIAPNCVGCLAAVSQSTSTHSDMPMCNNGNEMHAVTTAINAQGNYIPSSSVCMQTNAITCTNSSESHMLQKSAIHSSATEQVIIASNQHRRSNVMPAVVTLRDAARNDCDSAMSSPESVITESSIHEEDTSLPAQKTSIVNHKSDDNDSVVDDIDANVLLTAKTFSQHEENLRLQHRRIEELQAELAKSQEQLRREQQLIIAVKKLQLRKDEKTGKECTQAQILLNNLDIKNINKTHIQHFLQHKNQHQHLQSQASSYEQLLQVEQKLQEELHIEQAVQDIVRLIKQDGRTALLIVQLLRRYQLERNHQLQQNTSNGSNNATTAKQFNQGRSAANRNISEQLTQTELKMQSQSNFENCAKGRSTTETECRCCVKETMHCVSRSNSSSNSAPVVVIDDSPMPSPKIVSEKPQKPIVQPSKEQTSRTKVQTTKNTKRKNTGTRSIWSENNVEKSTSSSNVSKQIKSVSKNVTPPASTKVNVDMEEIFRTVINDVNQYSEMLSLIDRNTQKINEQQAEQYEDVQLEEHEQMDASSELVPQLNEFHLVNGNEEPNLGMNNDVATHHSQGVPMDTEYNQVYYPDATAICNTTAVFVQPEMMSSCHADCFSKPGNENSPERLQILDQRQDFLAKNVEHQQLQPQQQVQYRYHNNEDFEDLMDVLRDDQEGIVPNNGYDNTLSGKELLGYTSSELATFLQSDCEKIPNGVGGNNDYEGYQHVQLVDMNNEGYMQHQPLYQQINTQPQHDQMHQVYVHNTNCDNGEYSNDELSLGQHQDQAFSDMLNQENLDSSVAWFDNFFDTPTHGPQMLQQTFRPPATPLV